MYERYALLRATLCLELTVLGLTCLGGIISLGFGMRPEQALFQSTTAYFAGATLLVAMVISIVGIRQPILLARGWLIGLAVPIAILISDLIIAQACSWWLMPFLSGITMPVAAAFARQQISGLPR